MGSRHNKGHLKYIDSLRSGGGPRQQSTGRRVAGHSVKKLGETGTVLLDEWRGQNQPSFQPQLSYYPSQSWRERGEWPLWQAAQTPNNPNSLPLRHAAACWCLRAVDCSGDPRTTAWARGRHTVGVLPGAVWRTAGCGSGRVDERREVGMQGTGNVH